MCICACGGRGPCSAPGRPDPVPLTKLQTGAHSRLRSCFREGVRLARRPRLPENPFKLSERNASFSSGRRGWAAVPLPVKKRQHCFGKDPTGRPRCSWSAGNTALPGLSAGPPSGSLGQMPTEAASPAAGLLPPAASAPPGSSEGARRPPALVF